MVQVVKEEKLLLQKEQEALGFVGKNGPGYVQNLATEEEKKHFEGVLYCGGIPILTLISYMTSHVNPY